VQFKRKNLYGVKAEAPANDAGTRREPPGRTALSVRAPLPPNAQLSQTGARVDVVTTDALTLQLVDLAADAARRDYPGATG
jgi:hypothetical protein